MKNYQSILALLAMVSTQSMVQAKVFDKVEEALYDVVHALDHDADKAWSEFKLLLPRRHKSNEQKAKTVHSIKTSWNKVKPHVVNQQHAERWIQERLHEYEYGLDNFRKERQTFKDNYLPMLHKKHAKQIKHLQDKGVAKAKIHGVKKLQQDQIKHLEKDNHFQKSIAPLEQNITARLRAGVEAKQAMHPQQAYEHMYEKLSNQLKDQKLLHPGTEYEKHGVKSLVQRMKVKMKSSLKKISKLASPVIVK